MTSDPKEYIARAKRPLVDETPAPARLPPEVVVGSDLPPQSTKVARRGVRSGQDFADLMLALMADVIEGRIDPSVANAACNAGGKLLQMVTLQHKYGKKDGASDLMLAAPKSKEVPPK